MQLTIIGAGAIGGTIGAHLIRDGHDVLLCDADQEHVDAINRSGLSIEGPVENFTVAPALELGDGLGLLMGGADRGHRADAVATADAVTVPWNARTWKRGAEGPLGQAAQPAEHHGRGRFGHGATQIDCRTR